jgi:hypothetical protein
MSTGVETASEIRTFNVDIPQEELADIRRRITATRWPGRRMPRKARSSSLGSRSPESSAGRRKLEGGPRRFLAS